MRTPRELELFKIFDDIVAAFNKYPKVKVPFELLSEKEAKDYANKNGLIWRKVEDGVEGFFNHEFIIKN